MKNMVKRFWHGWMRCPMSPYYRLPTGFSSFILVARFGWRVKCRSVPEMCCQWSIRREWDGFLRPSRKKSPKCIPLRARAILSRLSRMDRLYWGLGILVRRRRFRSWKARWCCLKSLPGSMPGPFVWVRKSRMPLFESSRVLPLGLAGLIWKTSAHRVALKLNRS